MSSDLKKLLKEAGLDKVPLGDLLGGLEPACGSGTCDQSCTNGCSQGCFNTNQPGPGTLEP